MFILIISIIVGCIVYKKINQYLDRKPDTGIKLLKK